MTALRKPDADKQRRDAQETLRALGDEPAVLGSSLAAAGRRAARHFSGQNPDEAAVPDDGIELWGRRIGRALSLIGVIGLAIYLYLTYLR